MHQKWHNFPQKSVFLSSNGKYQTCAHQTFSEDFLGPYLLEKRHLVGIQRLFIFSYFGDSLFLACGINLFSPVKSPFFIEMKRYLAELLVIMISSHGCSWNSDILNNEKFLYLGCIKNGTIFPKNQFSFHQMENIRPVHTKLSVKIF